MSIASPTYFSAWCLFSLKSVSVLDRTEKQRRFGNLFKIEKLTLKNIKLKEDFR